MRSSLISIGITATAVLMVSSGCTTKQETDNCCVIDKTYVHKYGVAVPPEDWTTSGRNGKVISTLKNGVVVTHNYVAGRLEGDTSYSYPYSEVTEKVESYQKNTLVRDVIYYSSGAPRQETIYQPDGSRTVSSWYETGTPATLERYDGNDLLFEAEYSNTFHQTESSVNNREGLRIVRDQYGQLVSHDEIRDGLMVLQTTYHQNGTPEEIIPFVNSAVSGKKRTFLPGGEPDTIEEWSDGSQEGVTIVFKNGEKFAEITYSNGAKNGTERRYRNGSLLVEEITWQDNLKHGPETVYVSDGAKTEWFFQGKPVTKGNFELSSRSIIPTKFGD